MESFLSGDVRIAYVDEGPRDGDPLLMIHGFASNHKVNWVETGWVKLMTDAGRRVIAVDNRGHGASDKLYNPNDYSSPMMADDAAALLDHLQIACADVIGYSMGARITAFLAMGHGQRVRSAVFGGMGERMILGMNARGSDAIADALEAPSAAEVTAPGPAMFRKFAERTGGDLLALAACMRSGRNRITPEALGEVSAPVLVAVGDKDDVGGPPGPLAAVIPNGRALVLAGRDHMTAVGAREFKAGVAGFLEARA